MEIHESDVDMRHIAGNLNLADAPSRALQQAQEEPISSDDIKRALRNDVCSKRAQLAARRYKLLDDKLYVVKAQCEFQVPADADREELIRSLHLSLGHAKAHALQSILSRDVRWDCMGEDIAEVVRGCPECQCNGRGVKIMHPSTWTWRRSHLEPFDLLRFDLNESFFFWKN